MPGRQHEPQLRPAAHHQQFQLSLRLGRDQLVHIIEHQPEPVPQRRQVLQQPLHHRPPVQVRRRRQLPDQPRPRRSLAQCAHYRRPEPLRITFVAPDRHPPGAVDQARFADPRPEQHRLPAARRRRDHGHPGRRPEPLEQPGTGHDSARARMSAPAGYGVRSFGGPHAQIFARPKSSHWPRVTNTSPGMGPPAHPAREGSPESHDAGSPSRPKP
jgi:hypothetical protein